MMERRNGAEIQESFPSEVVVEKDTTKVDNTYESHTSPLKLLESLQEIQVLAFINYVSGKLMQDC